MERDKEIEFDRYKTKAKTKTPNRAKNGQGWLKMNDFFDMSSYGVLSPTAYPRASLIHGDYVIQLAIKMYESLSANSK